MDNCLVNNNSCSIEREITFKQALIGLSTFVVFFLFIVSGMMGVLVWKDSSLDLSTKPINLAYNNQPQPNLLPPEQNVEPSNPTPPQKVKDSPQPDNTNTENELSDQKADSEESDKPYSSVFSESDKSRYFYNPIKGQVFHKLSPGRKRVALTFDDGPYKYWTTKYIQVLKEHQVPATFFLIGTRMNNFPDLTKYIVDQGFEVGGHSFSHKNLKLFNQKTLYQDFWQTSIAFYHATGSKLKFFRPPYGSYGGDVVSVAGELGQYLIMWNIDPKDWKGAKAQQIVNHIDKNVKDGAIILLHEGKKETFVALPQIIKCLQEKGYEFVPVSELLKPSKNDVNQV